MTRKDKNQLIIDLWAFIEDGGPEEDFFALRARVRQMQWDARERRPKEPKEPKERKL